MTIDRVRSQPLSADNEVTFSNTWSPGTGNRGVHVRRTMIGDQPQKLKQREVFMSDPGRMDGASLLASTVAGSTQPSVRTSKTHSGALDRQPRIWLQLLVNVVSCKGLPQADDELSQGSSDPFVVCEVLGTQRFQTPVIRDRLDPIFNYEREIFDYPEEEPLSFTVWDSDANGADSFLGSTELPYQSFWPVGFFEGSLPLSQPDSTVAPSIQLKIRVLGQSPAPISKTKANTMARMLDTACHHETIAGTTNVGVGGSGDACVGASADAEDPTLGGTVQPTSSHGAFSSNPHTAARRPVVRQPRAVAQLEMELEEIRTVLSASSSAEELVERYRPPKEVRSAVSSPVCSVELINMDIFHWEVTLAGPEGTPYRGGWFRFTFRFPADYPVHPPCVRCLTPVFHCNIDENGAVCLGNFDGSGGTVLSLEKRDVSVVDTDGNEKPPVTIRRSDRAAATISTESRSYLRAPIVLEVLYSMFRLPEPQEALVPAAAKLFMTDRKIYNKLARDWTIRYAL